MTTTTPTEPGKDLARRLGLSDFGETARTCSRIARLAKTYIGIQEELCGGPRWSWNGGNWQWTQKWQDKMEQRDASIEQKIREAVAELGEGYGVNFNGDPRGCCVYITAPDGRYDSWGKVGICARND